MGSRRNNGRGTWRSPDITTRIVPGTQISSRLALTASDDRLGDLIRRRRQRRRVEAIGHLGADEAGPDHQDAYAVLAQRLAEAEEEPVEARLGGPVDEVGPAYPLTGDAGQGDDAAVGLRPHPVGQQDTEVDRGGVVDLGQLERMIRIAPRPLGVAEQAERDHRDVDVAVGEGGVDGRSVRAVVPGIKIDFGDRAAQIAQLGRGPRTPLGRPGRQHHPQPALAGVAPGDGERDVGRAAEQQDRLRAAQGVDHHSSPLGLVVAALPRVIFM